MTNAERVTKMIAENGAKSVLIHSVPSTPFWLVMYKTKETQRGWRCVLCNPEQTTWRLVTEKITDQEYDQLWKDLLKIRIGNNLKYAVNDLKKQVENFKQYKI